ncbi:hypothetical protein LTR36_010330 [Oleoguttula mirabilis]|uniref:Uncharacterized protein n=1 Tax=Oleoguttula mirabilis TaxID=1507867 RepID=A0AAV9J4B9_9PEZI|nr:hypothetical protein LTR36_010330 [Oleoguttula mirabilis]
MQAPTPPPTAHTHTHTHNVSHGLPGPVYYPEPPLYEIDLLFTNLQQTSGSKRPPTDGAAAEAQPVNNPSLNHQSVSVLINPMGSPSAGAVANARARRMKGLAAFITLFVIVAVMIGLVVGSITSNGGKDA